MRSCGATPLTSLLFVNYGNLFSNLLASPRFFNDSLISAVHGADLSGLISATVAAAVYLGVRRLRPS